MDNMKTEQIEALITAADYCKKLVTAIDNLAGEFENGRLEDTDQYAEEVLDGINWVIQVYNGTKELIRSLDVNIEEENVNGAVAQLTAAYESGDDAAKAKVLRTGLLDFVNGMILAGAKLN